MLRFWFLMLLLLGPITTVAAEDQGLLAADGSPIILDKKTEFPKPIVPYVNYHRDESGLLSIEDIINPDTEWNKSNVTTLNFGLTKHTIWLIFQVVSKDIPDTPLFLEIPFPVIDYVNFYQYENNKLIQKNSVGDMYPFSQRPIPHRNLLIPLQIKSNSRYDFYVSFQMDGSLQIEASIVPEKTFWKNSQIENFVGEVYYGVMIAMISYNLFIFFIARKISYIYYSLYIISFALFNATIRGYSLQLLWPNSVEWNSFAPPFFIFCSIAFLSFFSADFLKLRNKGTRVHIFLKGCGFTAIFLLIPVFFLPKVTSILIGGALAIPACAVAISASLFYLISGYKPARYFCIALLAFLLSVIVLIFNKFGLISSNFFTEYAAQIGSAVEAILLSFAQAEKSQEEKIELFNQKEEAFQRSTTLKNEFLATISHEFRTPMNGLIGCLDLAKKADSKTSRNELLENASDSSYHLKHLLDNILLYSEVLNGTLKARYEPVVFKNWLNENCTPFELRPANTNIVFVRNISHDIPDTIVIDPNRLGKVFEHILINAFKFTNNGTIKLDIDFMLNKSGQNMLLFNVEDTGVGMTPEQLNSVFSLFQQADGSHRRKYGGLGVGTAVCKALVESMQGSIIINSKHHCGTIVSFSVPIEIAPSIVEKKPTLVLNPAQKTILIVEDNAVNRIVLKKILKQEGFRVICAENGKEGVAEVEANVIDLVLMDCQMPIMDGFEAVTIIRSMPVPKANIPIIAVTANTMSGDKQHCLDVGMNDYVPKPINPQELELKIHQWLAPT